MRMDSWLYVTDKENLYIPRNTVPCHFINHSCIRTDVGSNPVLRIKRMTDNGLNHDMASDSKFVINKSQKLLLMSKYSQNVLFKYLIKYLINYTTEKFSTEEESYKRP